MDVACVKTIVYANIACLGTLNTIAHAVFVVEVKGVLYAIMKAVSHVCPHTTSAMQHVSVVT